MHVNQSSIRMMKLATLAVIPAWLLLTYIGVTLGAGGLFGEAVIVTYVIVMFSGLITMIHVEAWEEPFLRWR